MLSLTFCSNMNAQSWLQEAPVAIRNAKTSAETDKDRGRSLLADPHELRDRVAAKLDKNPIRLNPAGYYMPDDELELLFTAAAVQSALGGIFDNDLINFVLQDAKKIFAILLLVFKTRGSRERAMKAFQITTFTDEKLSSIAFELPSAALELCPPHCTHKDEKSSHHFPYREPWDPTSLKDFKSKRWQFLVPKLDHKVFEYRLDAQQLLPFRRGNSPQYSTATSVKLRAWRC